MRGSKDGGIDAHANVDADATTHSDANVNPFVSFRRYADSQISSLLDSFGLATSRPASNGEDKQDIRAGLAETKKQAPYKSKTELLGGDDRRKTSHWSERPEQSIADAERSQDGTEDSMARLDQDFDEASKNAEKMWQLLRQLSISGITTGEAEEDNVTQGSAAMYGAGDRLEHAANEPFQEDDDSPALLDHCNPCDCSRLPEDIRTHSRILNRIESLHSPCYPCSLGNGMPMMRGWSDPSASLLDQSDPRIRWLLYHAYSPLVLDAKMWARGYSYPWCTNAFNDLMNAESGSCRNRESAWFDWDAYPFISSSWLFRNLLSDDPCIRRFSRNIEKGGEWFVPEERVTKNQADSSSPLRYLRTLVQGLPTADLQSEMDMYEALLDDCTEQPKPQQQQQQQQQRTEQPSHDTKSASPLSPGDEATSSPVLATMSITRRNVAADGTVSTKWTWKERFSDGREESTEAVSTYRADSASENARGDYASGNAKKSGWFWSN